MQLGLFCSLCKFCFEYAILPVPLGCLFLIAPSGFSNVSNKTYFSLANVYSKTHNWHAVAKGFGASFHHEGRFGGNRKPGKWAVIYLWVCLFLQFWYLILELFQLCGFFSVFFSVFDLKHGVL